MQLQFKNKETEYKWHTVLSSNNLNSILMGIESRVEVLADRSLDQTYRLVDNDKVIWESGHCVLLGHPGKQI